MNSNYLEKTLLNLYQMGEDGLFYQKYGKVYMQLLKQGIDKKIQFGPLLPFSKEETHQLVCSFLEKYDFLQEQNFTYHLQDNIQLYTKEELDAFLNLEKNIPNMTFGEAKSLEKVRGNLLYFNDEYWNLHVYHTETLSSANTLVHEWIHKLDAPDIDFFDDGFYDMLSEVKAYYGSFLFLDDCKQQGYLSDSTIVSDQIRSILSRQILSYQQSLESLSCLQGYQQDQKLEQLQQNESFALDDYPNILWYLIASYYYQNKKDHKKASFLEKSLYQDAFLKTKVHHLLKSHGKNKIKQLVKSFYT